MVYLSRAYKSKTSKYRKSHQLKKTFDEALDFWVKNDFICENWWWNQIGTPNALISILLIMDNDLSKKQVSEILPIVSRANLNASGARPSGDRIKIAGLFAKVALFQRDVNTIDEIMPIIEGEIKFSNGTRGLQYDYSFHHRLDRVNNTNSYGLSYASTFVEWAKHVAGTGYAFSDRSIRILVDFYLDGICKQMVYGKINDPAILNRDISRRKHDGVSSPEIPMSLMQITDYRKNELVNFAAIRSGQDVEIPSFSKFFWETEHFVFQRPDFYTSVRMYSTRNANMELPYNGEGLTNHYRGDGTNYISLTGEEYRDLPPVYDWMRIPGTTTMLSETMPPENEIQKMGISEFVGGVSNGLYGAAVFDFKSPHNPLSAKKAWFFFDKEYVCLGAGLNSSSSRSVVTTLDQVRLQGDVILSAANKVSQLPSGEYSPEKVDWVYHNRVGYIFPTNQSVRLSNTVAKGSWFLINRSIDSPRGIVEENVFKLWINHGSNLKNASYEYVIMPASTQEEVQRYASSPWIKTISNTSDLQAVWHNNSNMGYAVFYKADKVPLTDKLTLSSDSPGLVLISCDEKQQIKEITVSDPSRKLSRLHLRVNQSITTADKNCHVFRDASGIETHLEFILPTNGYEGSSLTVKF
jgi:chondroitin AC lyase